MTLAMHEADGLLGATTASASIPTPGPRALPAQATENIGVFTTTHVPTVHPIVGAKIATTIDQMPGL